jgi:L-seryl-tRNA(Ser) seleniumtransferase
LARQSVRAALEAGFDLVIVRGDGFAGGPPCGVMLGSRELIGRVRAHAMFRAFQLDHYRAVAMTTTVECYGDGERSLESLPVWQLLTASVENLRNRAERIAPQLAQAEEVASAVAVETRSPISAALTADNGFESFGIALTARDRSADELEKRFRALPFPVCGRVEGERLILDLRTVLPKQDRVLVETITAPSSASYGADEGGTATIPPPNSPVDETNSTGAG